MRTRGSVWRLPCWIVTAISMAALVACRFPATEVLVVLGTDAPSDRVLTVSATIAAPGSARPATRTWMRGGGVAGAIDLPASFAVTPRESGGADAVELRIRATLAPGADSEPAVVFERVARFRLTARQTGVLRVYLAMACGNRAIGCTSVDDSQCTVSTLCSERGQTCGDRGECVSPDVVPEPRPSGDDGGILAFDVGADSAAADIAPEITDAGDEPCGAGQRACDGTCYALNDPAHCGDCIHSCGAPPNGAATCVSGVCAFTCAAGFHPCGATCARDSDVATCGSSCSPCPVPANGSATCTSGVCGIACDAGFMPSGGMCVVAMTCGNNLLEGTETCDDGNTAPGDGCFSNCHIEGDPADTCPGTVVLTPGIFRGYTTSMTPTFTFACGSSGPDVVYQFYPPVDGMLRITLTPDVGWDAILSTGASCSASGATCLTTGTMGMPAMTSFAVSTGVVVYTKIGSNVGFGSFTLRFEYL
jgi:cysteine-rich repeat protein